MRSSKFGFVWLLDPDPRDPTLRQPDGVYQEYIERTGELARMEVWHPEWLALSELERSLIEPVTIPTRDPFVGEVLGIWAGFDQRLPGDFDPGADTLAAEQLRLDCTAAGLVERFVA